MRLKPADGWSQVFGVYRIPLDFVFSSIMYFLLAMVGYIYLTTHLVLEDKQIAFFKVSIYFILISNYYIY